MDRRSSPARHVRVAVDSGGTFTDVFAVDGAGAVETCKVPSTPANPWRAVLDGLEAMARQLGPDAQIDEVRYGTTVATNALLERQGARLVLVLDAGFEDLLALGRQSRPELYALHPAPPAALVARSDVVAWPGRRDVHGAQVGGPVDLPAWVEAHRAAFEAAEAVAICLLHAPTCPDDERRIHDALAERWPGLRVSASHQIAPVPGELERATTTAVNAYVAPVMATALDALERRVGPPLSVMGSAGGLLTPGRARHEAVRTVLSGPAGGVEGAWRAGQRVGRGRLLALDMGGTSTDVALLDGPPSPAPDGQIEGWPLRTPLLSIETIGAGGGSIATVGAGGVLHVGPRSAGAVPGPACYGRAGAAAEPTVTDAHAILGHLPPALVGGRMALDLSAARGAMARLAAKLEVTVEDAARAVVAVAEAHMARACKRVSMQQGVDPAALTLVAFGGAGGLHACALADELGCREVLCPDHAGVLSAAGIATARRARDVTRTVFLDEASWDGPTLSELAAALTGAARAALLADWPAEAAASSSGGAPTGPSVRVWFDVRYTGQTHTVAVDLADVLAGADAGLSRETLRAAFDDAHRRRHGHALVGDDGHAELVAMRAEASVADTALPAGEVLDWSALPVVGEGPAALAQEGSTLWLPAGWQARRTTAGLLCRRVEGAAEDASRAARLAVEVHRERLAAIAEQMGTALERAAFSANIKERRDFSCAIFDADGQMLEHAAHIPVHVGSTPASVAAVRAAADRFEPGVDWVVNDPFAGGTHLPDITVVRPVFVSGERAPRFFVANRAHHADVGGITPGSMPAPVDAAGRPRRLTIDDEGVRLAPQRLTDDAAQNIAHASRTPDERLGDLAAQRAANATGERLLRDLVGQLGRETTRERDTLLLDHAEARVRAALRALPDGTHRFVDRLDGSADAPSAGPQIAVAITIEGDKARFDFAGTAKQTPGPTNAVRAVTVSSVLYCVRCLAGAISDDATPIPANAGMLRALQICTPPGSIVDAQPPAAVSSGNVETSQRIVDAVYGALAGFAPDLVPAASCGSMNNVLFGGARADGTAFVHYETLAGGAGGGPLGPGADAIHTHMTNTRNTSIEALERAFPVRLAQYALAPPAAALPDHVHRGGRGVVRAYTFLEPAEVTLVGERRTVPPWGRAAADVHRGGALAGDRGQAWLRHTDGRERTAPGTCTLHVEAGETVVVRTPGGGHYSAATFDGPVGAGQRSGER